MVCWLVWCFLYFVVLGFGWWLLFVAVVCIYVFNEMCLGGCVCC